MTTAIIIIIIIKYVFTVFFCYNAKLQDVVTHCQAEYERQREKVSMNRNRYDEILRKSKCYIITFSYFRT